jgi:hypothetical protein
MIHPAQIYLVSITIVEVVRHIVYDDLDDVLVKNLCDTYTIIIHAHCASRESFVCMEQNETPYFQIQSPHVNVYRPCPSCHRRSRLVVSRCSDHLPVWFAMSRCDRRKSGALSLGAIERSWRGCPSDVVSWLEANLRVSHFFPAKHSRAAFALG